MCLSEGVQASSLRPIAPTRTAKDRPRATALPKKQQHGNNRSWLGFLTGSFHGVLGASSLAITLAAWVSNELITNTSLALALTLLSVVASTVLSLHSSWYMLRQSPHQTTILDWRLELCADKSEASEIDANNAASAAAVASRKSLRLWVVAPHRGAFQRTSLIMQYANARVLLLLQRRHWRDPSSAAPSASGVLAWGLVSVACLRMLLGEKWPLPAFLKARSSNAAAPRGPATTFRPLPPFWQNGNSYCFVLPMVVSVCADFLVAAWCERSYFDAAATKDSLFDRHADRWLSLRHLLFLQAVAHVIAFAFTLAFRRKHASRKKDDDAGGDASSSPARMLCDIRTLYWTCTAGVYALVILGATKARTALMMSW